MAHIHIKWVERHQLTKAGSPSSAGFKNAGTSHGALGLLNHFRYPRVYGLHICTDPEHALHILTQCGAGGEERMEVFRRVVSVPDASKTSLTWSFAAFGSSQLWIAVRS